MLIEYLPILCFFVAYKFYGIISATLVLIIAYSIQLIYFYISDGKVDKKHLVTFILIVVFGGLTVYLRNPIYLMYKVSIINILFGITFIGSIFIGKKTITERILGEQIDLPKKIWIQLSWAWSGLFFLIAAINIYFVLPSIKASKNFMNAYNYINKEEELASLDCTTNIASELCTIAQQTEHTWVNFKMFGTIGLTLVFIIATMLYASKHIKTDIEK